MKKYLLIFMVIAFIIGAAYFIFKFYDGAKPVPTSSTSESTTTVTMPQNTTTVITPKTWTVEYKDNKFIPSEIKIKKGDMVVWTNFDSSSTWPASAFHPTHQVYPGFDALKGLSKGESYSFKFDKVGSWKYHDHLNPSVYGTVVVEE